jgi:type I restriction enzyme S subunit
MTTMAKVKTGREDNTHSADLPEGWVTATLGDIVSKLVDGSHNPPPKQTKGRPMLSARNIGDGSFLLNEGYRLISEKDFKVEHARTQVTPGDVLLTIVGSIGRSLVVPENTEAFALQRSVAVIRPILADPAYLTYNFRAPGLQSFFQENSAGTAQMGVYLGTLSDMPLPLAPIAEQRRIVAKIKELLEHVSASHHSLAKAHLTLKRFRQSVLAAACSGRLTEEWREVNNLPGWQYAPLEEAGVQVQIGPFGSLLHRHDYVENGIPLINPTHIKDGRIFPPTDCSVPPTKANELAQYRMRKGDVVLGRRGEMGRAAVIGDAADGYLCGTGSLFVRPTSGKIDPNFLCFVLRSPQVKSTLEGTAVGSTMTNLNQGIVGDLDFPEVHIREQHEIVRRVEALFKLADTIEKRVDAATNRADKLPQAILAKAFRGELVPTEAELARREGREYESASTLLERIRRVRARTNH